MPTTGKSSKPRPAIEDAPAGGASSVASARGDAGESGAWLHVESAGFLALGIAVWGAGLPVWASCYSKSL